MRALQPTSARTLLCTCGQQRVFSHWIVRPEPTQDQQQTLSLSFAHTLSSCQATRVSAGTTTDARQVHGF